MENNNNQSQHYNKENLQYEAMSVKEWLGTLLLLMIPFANFVLLFVWAFGDNAVNKSKKNFCRAYLILLGIVLGIYALIIAFVVAITILSSI